MSYHIECAGPDEDWASSAFTSFENLGRNLDAYVGRVEVAYTDSHGNVCRWRSVPVTTPVTVELTDNEIAALTYGYPHAAALDKLKAAARDAARG